MKSLLSDIAICMCCCGPTYRKSALEKLNNLYYSDPKIHYFIITDDKSFFNSCKIKNLTVNSLEELQDDPQLESYEFYLKSNSIEDYAKKFNDTKYKYPFFSNRFHFLQILKYKKCKINLVFHACTDAYIDIPTLILNESKITRETDTIGCILSQVDDYVSEDSRMIFFSQLLHSTFNLQTKDKVTKYDGAARFFMFSSHAKMKNFLEIYNQIIKLTFLSNNIKHLWCRYAYTDVPVLATVANSIGLYRFSNHDFSNRLMRVKHVPTIDRFFKP